MKIIILLLSSLSICITVGGQHHFFQGNRKGNAYMNISDLYPIKRSDAQNKNIKSNSEFTLRVDSTSGSYYEENELMVNYRSTNFFNSNNQFVSTVSWGYTASGEVSSYSQSDVAYNSIGEIQEIKWCYRYGYYTTPDGETEYQTVEQKTTFNYDIFGNVIEENHFEKPDPSADWTPQNRTVFEYNSNGKLIKRTLYSFNLADNIWDFLEEIRYFYEAETNRPILKETYSQSFFSGELIFSNKTEYNYNDVENSYTVVNYTRPFPFTDEWLPQTKDEFILNSQNQVISHIEKRFSPDEVIFSHTTREFDDSFNLVREIIDRNEDFFTFTTDFMREYEIDASVNLSDVYIPITYDFEFDVEVYFDQMISKATDFTRENNSMPWALSGETKLFYGAFGSSIELQEGTFIYPNPASTVLNTIYPANTQFRLYNTLGQVVFETTTTIDNETLTLPALVTGTYIYKSSIDDGKVVIR